MLFLYDRLHILIGKIRKKVLFIIVLISIEHLETSYLQLMYDKLLYNLITLSQTLLMDYVACKFEILHAPFMHLWLPVHAPQFRYFPHPSYNDPHV